MFDYSIGSDLFKGFWRSVGLRLSPNPPYNCLISGLSTRHNKVGRLLVQTGICLAENQPVSYSGNIFRPFHQALIPDAIPGIAVKYGS